MDDPKPEVHYEDKMTVWAVQRHRCSQSGLWALWLGSSGHRLKKGRTGLDYDGFKIYSVCDLCCIRIFRAYSWYKDPQNLYYGNQSMLLIIDGAKTGRHGGKLGTYNF